MPTSSISSPFPIFTDIDGQPLENGYIFIGVANLGPIGNPVNVYWDAALTIPAAQPIRTLGGYPVNNGTPARLYVNSQYSIQVQNRNGSVIYSAPVDNDFLSSEDVSYLPSGTGAVATTVQTELRKTIFATDYGAVGDGTTDDSAALALAVAACPVGGTLRGNGLTYKATTIVINKSIIVDGLIIKMTQASGSPTVQKAIEVTANYVTLKNCGTIYTLANVPTTANCSGVFSENTTGLVIDGGIFDGSRNGNYGVGMLHSPIQLNTCTDCEVMGTLTKNAGAEAMYLSDCIRPNVHHNRSYAGAGSAIVVYGTSSLVSYNYCEGGTDKNSGMAVGGTNPIVSFNHVKNAASNGISVGEGGITNGLICNNFVENAGAVASVGTTVAGILVQFANDTVVKDNYIGATAVNNNNTNGIAFTNGPVSFECTDNYIELPNGSGVHVNDGLNAAKCIIQNNTINSAYYYGVVVTGCVSIAITGNTIDKANRSNFASGHSISISNPTVNPTLINVSGNTITDSTGQAKYGVYLANVMASSTLFTLKNNNILSWTSEPYVSGRSCTYDVGGNNYSFTARSGLLTLTNGGTSTVLSSTQLSPKDTVVFQIGNTACYTLNPKYWNGGQLLGSLTLIHTAGTAAGEQIKWAVL